MAGGQDVTGQVHRRSAVVLVVLVVGVSLAAAALVSFRATGLVLAGGLVLLAAARGLLPPGFAAPLAVRSRGLDVVVALVLAVALVVLSLWSPSPGGPPPPPPPPR